MNFTGRGFTSLSISFDGHILCTLSREEAVKAHIIQFAALFVVMEPGLNPNLKNPGSCMKI